ncbi:MAG: hypothetical protein M4579_003995 [Chaenotheca gracillima]|nr:MAG: hypothetical protein M4579_003995 [Chaenotheca gracillima]
MTAGNTHTGPPRPDRYLEETSAGTGAPEAQTTSPGSGSSFYRNPRGDQKVHKWLDGCVDFEETQGVQEAKDESERIILMKQLGYTSPNAHSHFSSRRKSEPSPETLTTDGIDLSSLEQLSDWPSDMLPASGIEPSAKYPMSIVHTGSPSMGGGVPPKVCPNCCGSVSSWPELGDVELLCKSCLSGKSQGQKETKTNEKQIGPNWAWSQLEEQAIESCDKHTSRSSRYHFTRMMSAPAESEAASDDEDAQPKRNRSVQLSSKRPTQQMSHDEIMDWKPYGEDLVSQSQDGESTDSDIGGGAPI